MSEHTELVAHLRGFTLCGCNGCWNSMQLAADAIEALGRQYEVRGEILTAAIERAEKAERERDAAVADNAALLEIATAAVSATPNDDWRNRWFSRLETDHPGAALQARLARYDRRVTEDGDE